MRTKTAEIILACDVTLAVTYEWYVEYDGEYTVVILEKPKGDQEWDYELVHRQPVNSEMEAESIVDQELRQAIKTLISGYILVRS